MQILLPQTPPQVSVALAWRDLYGTGAFGQRELAEGDALRSAAEERSLRVGSDRGLLESLDLQGALSPIAFSAGYMSGFEVPAQPVDSMRFREEEGSDRLGGIPLGAGWIRDRHGPVLTVAAALSRRRPPRLQR